MPVGGWEFIDSKKKIIIPVILLGIIVWSISFLWETQDPFSAPGNYLAVRGGYTGPESYEIPIIKPVNLNNLTLDVIKKLRSDVVLQHRLLLEGNKYKPLEWLFDDIVQDLPWVSIRDLYFIGPQDAGEPPNIWNEAAASRLIVNPFLLVKAEFLGLSIWGPANLMWDKEQYDESAIAALGISPYPVEQKLVYVPTKLHAEVTYDITSFISQINLVTSQPLLRTHIDFAVILPNALDFSYKFIHLDPANSQNISYENNPDTPLPIIDRFEEVVPTWNEQGRHYNHFAGTEGIYDKITVIELPAVAVFKLWFDAPPSPETPCNFLWYIKII